MKSIDRPMTPRDWLMALGALVATNMSLKDTRERLAIYAPLLSGDFGSFAFNQQSLAFVASKTEFFPTFHRVSELLREWCKDHPPPPRVALLTGPAELGWQQKNDARMAQAKADWSDAVKVRQSRDGVLSSDVRQLELGRMLAALVHRHAPANLNLLPPEWHPAENSRNP